MPVAGDREVIMSQLTSFGKGCSQRTVKMDEPAAELRTNSDVYRSFSRFLGVGGQSREVSFVLHAGCCKLLWAAVAAGAVGGLPRFPFRPGTRPSPHAASCSSLGPSAKDCPWPMGPSYRPQAQGVA